MSDAQPEPSREYLPTKLRVKQVQRQTNRASPAVFTAQGRETFFYWQLHNSNTDSGLKQRSPCLCWLARFLFIDKLQEITIKIASVRFSGGGSLLVQTKLVNSSGIKHGTDTGNHRSNRTLYDVNRRAAKTYSQDTLHHIQDLRGQKGYRKTSFSKTNLNESFQTFRVRLWNKHSGKERCC